MKIDLAMQMGCADPAHERKLLKPPKLFIIVFRSFLY